jgi:membrane associated rhomboid family serine protease
MIFKILKLPVWVICRALGSVVTLIRLILSFVFGILRFISSHLTGTVFGALVGLLLGRRHIGVKVFNHRHKKFAR